MIFAEQSSIIDQKEGRLLSGARRGELTRGNRQGGSASTPVPCLRAWHAMADGLGMEPHQDEHREPAGSFTCIAGKRSNA
jgi:hypothetical protein